MPPTRGLADLFQMSLRHARGDSITSACEEERGALLRLPDEIWGLVLQGLSAERVPMALARVRRTCRRMRALASAPVMWERACTSRGWAPGGPAPPHWQPCAVFGMRMRLRVRVRRAIRRKLGGGGFDSSLRGARLHFGCRKGACEQHIDAFERAAGVRLSLELREAFRETDGQDETGPGLLPGGCRMLSLAEILEQLENEWARRPAPTRHKDDDARTRGVRVPLSDTKGFRQIVTFAQPLYEDEDVHGGAAARPVTSHVFCLAGVVDIHKARPPPSPPPFSSARSHARRVRPVPATPRVSVCVCHRRRHRAGRRSWLARNRRAGQRRPCTRTSEAAVQ